MASIFRDDDRWFLKFQNLLSNCDPRIRMYIYRYVDGEIAKPYLYGGPLIENFLPFTRDEFGGGDFYVIIRCGKTMELASDFGIELPLSDPRRQAVVW